VSAVPEEKDTVRDRVRESYERAVEANRREREALEELGLLLYADRTAADPAIARGMAYMAQRIASGEVPPKEALSRDQFLAKGKAKRRSS
jgi:hypothetical protein